MSISALLLFFGTLALSLWATWRVKRVYLHYKDVPASSGITGAEAAAEILQRAGITDVEIVPHETMLGDHYDPIHKRLVLSKDNFYGTSLAALGVSAHECGHAIQHAQGYAPLQFRTTIFPLANIGTSLSWLFIIAGLLFAPGFRVAGVSLLDVGILLFLFAVVFQVLTLPVEFDASKRALVQLNQLGLVSPQEQTGAKRVLNAAALTYVAAAASAVLQLVRLLLIRDRRD